MYIQYVCVRVRVLTILCFMAKKWRRMQMLHITIRRRDSAMSMPSEHKCVRACVHACVCVYVCVKPSWRFHFLFGFATVTGGNKSLPRITLIYHRTLLYHRLKSPSFVPLDQTTLWYHCPESPSFLYHCPDSPFFVPLPRSPSFLYHCPKLSSNYCPKWFWVGVQTPQTPFWLLLVRHCRYSTLGYQYRPSQWVRCSRFSLALSLLRSLSISFSRYLCSLSLSLSLYACVCVCVFVCMRVSLPLCIFPSLSPSLPLSLFSLSLVRVSVSRVSMHLSRVPRMS